MRVAVALSSVAIIVMAVALASCGGGSSSSPVVTATGTPAETATSAPTATATSAPAPDGDTDTFDLTLTGGREARWQTGDDGTGITCASIDDRMEAAIYGGINNSTYSFTISQQMLTPGSFSIPEDANPNTTPKAQIVTSADPQAEWDLTSGSGTSGTIELAGGARSPLIATVDGDLADKLGGAPVHISGTFTCTLQVN